MKRGHQYRSGLEGNGSLLFDGGVDIVAAFWEDGYNKCWCSLCLQMALITRSTELLRRELVFEKKAERRLTRAIFPWPDSHFLTAGLGAILMPIRPLVWLRLVELARRVLPTATHPFTKSVIIRPADCSLKCRVPSYMRSSQFDTSTGSNMNLSRLSNVCYHMALG